MKATLQVPETARALAEKALPTAGKKEGEVGFQSRRYRINAIWHKILGLRKNLHHQISRLLVRKYQVTSASSPSTSPAWTSSDSISQRPSGDWPAVRSNCSEGKSADKADWYGTVGSRSQQTCFPSSKYLSPMQHVSTTNSNGKSIVKCPTCGAQHETKRKLAALQPAEIGPRSSS